MKRWARPVLILTALASLTAAGTFVAYANWIVPSKQIQIKIKSADMPRGVTPSVTGSDGGALVSWHAQEIGPGARMQSYVVTAHSVAQRSRPDITHILTATGRDTESMTFGFGELAGGGWYWTLVPKFQSWAGEESQASDRLTFATPTGPPTPSGLLAGVTPAAAAPPPTATPSPISVQSASAPASSSSPTPSDSTIPVLPTPPDSAKPLPPPPSSSPGPPPPPAF